MAPRRARKRTTAPCTHVGLSSSLYCPGGRRQRLLLQLRECEKNIAELRSLHGLRLTCRLALGVALRSRSLRVKKVRALCAEPEEQSPMTYTQQSQAELL